MSTSTSFRVAPGGALTGTVKVPGDKSVSHRAAILGGLASGRTEIDGFLAGLDTLATLNAMSRLGANVVRGENGHVVIDGVGERGLQPCDGPLDLGNSGTGMRLLAGVLAGQSFATTMIGDASLSGRPMGRIATPLAAMNAVAHTAAGGTPPLLMGGGPTRLKAIDYAMPMASAQVKSCLLLATLYAEGTTRITEPAPTRDHTERMLRGFGASVTSAPDPQTGLGVVAMAGGQALQGTNLQVPADLSSAAFFLVGASIAPGSELRITGVGMNPTRSGVIDILQQMGADVTISGMRDEAGEPVADLTVRAAELRGIDIPPELVPLAIDEFPAIFVAAACATGATRLRGAEELRVKESDRIGVMAQGLTALGVTVEVYEDGLEIQGLGATAGVMTGGSVDSHGDHRIAMSFAIAGLRASGTIEIGDCANVETSFPGFVDTASRLGLSIQSRVASP